MQADKLAAEFGIAGILRFEDTDEGLVKATIACDGAEAELFLQGAQLTRWAPRGERPVLFLSERSAFAPGKAIRGGIPVIFPWFGPHPTNPAAPQHGFARTAAWRLDAVHYAAGDGLTMTLHLEPTGSAAPFWDKPVQIAYSLTIGSRLRLALTARNSTDQEIVFEEALHSYFAVSEVTQASVSGLENCLFIDKTAGLRRKRAAAAPLTLAGETDSMFLDTADTLHLTDTGWGRRISLAKAGARSTIVWNPWREKAGAMADLGETAWRSMICVETGNVADNAIRLAAGAEHTMSTVIAVGPIAADA
jgi:glucose-6-phosphate 1-epimerase